MSSPHDPEELFRQMVPELAQNLTDRLLAVATEYLACMNALEALKATSDDPAVESVVNAAEAVRSIVAGREGQRLTNEQLERILHATGLTLPPETLN